MARPNIIKSSKYRKQIDKMLAQSESYANIHRWLKKKGESISRQTISNYHKKNFNIHNTAIGIYTDQNSKNTLNDTTKAQIDILNYYDKLIEKGQQTGFDKMSDKEIHSLATKAAKQKTDYLKDSGGSEDKYFVIKFVSDEDESDRVEADKETES